MAATGSKGTTINAVPVPESSTLGKVLESVCLAITERDGHAENAPVLDAATRREAELDRTAPVSEFVVGLTQFMPMPRLISETDSSRMRASTSLLIQFLYYARVMDAQETGLLCYAMAHSPTTGKSYYSQYTNNLSAAAAAAGAPESKEGASWNWSQVVAGSKSLLSAQSRHLDKSYSPFFKDTIEHYNCALRFLSARLYQILKVLVFWFKNCSLVCSSVFKA